MISNSDKNCQKFKCVFWSCEEQSRVALDLGCILMCRTTLETLGFRHSEFSRAAYLAKATFTHKNACAAAAKRPNLREIIKHVHHGANHRTHSRPCLPHEPGGAIPCHIRDAKLHGTLHIHIPFCLLHHVESKPRNRDASFLFHQDHL